MGKKNKNHKTQPEQKEKQDEMKSQNENNLNNEKTADSSDKTEEKVEKVFSDLKELSTEIEKTVFSFEKKDIYKKAENNIKNLFSKERFEKSLNIIAADIAKKHNIDKNDFLSKLTRMAQSLHEGIDRNFIVSRVINSVINKEARVDDLLMMSREELKYITEKELVFLSKAGESLLNETLAQIAEPLAQMMSQSSKEAERITKIEKENIHLKNENQRLRTIANERAELVESYRKDCENIKRKSSERELRIQQNAAEKIALDLLHSLDSFDRALAQKTDDPVMQSHFDGFKAIYNQILMLLSKHGVNMIESDNQEFDPNLHEAVFHLETNDFPEGIIVETTQKGYMINESVLRHSKVVVAKKAE
jgi:molecular chaperone GrpE